VLLYAVFAVYENQGWAGNPFRQRNVPAPQSQLALEQIPFNGQRAYDNLVAICDLGPRISGSPGMLAQQEMLIDHFQKLGGKVNLQRFRVRHPRDGSEVRMANLLVRWHPDRKERILVCAHYDTRPYPDRDPNDPRGVFIGANDGASGPALLMELALHVREFIARPKHEVRDDHLPLRQTGKIAAIDIIDFDYPYWHTTADTPDKCSALSLAKVGWVLSEWIKSAARK
jgi:hypothetical protein